MLVNKPVITEHVFQKLQVCIQVGRWKLKNTTFAAHWFHLQVMQLTEEKKPTTDNECNLFEHSIAHLNAASCQQAISQTGTDIFL